jgi:hypothetical protein
MNLYYSIKQQIKLMRWRTRRAAAALRWGPGALKHAPAVLGNAMPKSGSHLIIQVLQGLTRIGPFVNPGFPPVNRSEDNQKLSDPAVLTNIQRMQPGDIGYGYVGASRYFVDALTGPGRATIFVFRDPRDMIVSHVFYATQMHPGHWMHHYYNEVLHSMEERIQAAIRGVEEQGSELTPVRKRYEGYLDWLEQPAVLCLRFEELILNRDAALTCLLDYIEGRGFTPSVQRQHALQALQEAIAPKRSGTFRKGQPGNWREHFTEANKTLFKELAGDLLVRLGYEQDEDW